MTADIQGQTATIIQFPAGGRSAAQRARFAVQAEAQLPAPIAVGDSWYHQEAVLEAERDRRN